MGRMTDDVAEAYANSISSEACATATGSDGGVKSKIFMPVSVTRSHVSVFLSSFPGWATLKSRNWR